MEKRVTMVDGIKVTINGEISEYNKKLYNERLAMILFDELGSEACEELLNLLKKEDEKK
ncbi:Uncharacterised protein [uncultured Clostridium sp.]|uniref:hypothetical protein n=1 Tax=uncultured Clostridium sp. TaxID=59620 RepID=UPI000820ABD8|nr:hypothetical protein [uncultured Clostridium sp.]SCJ53236.1 Uncharacterised protein [uncultured Clostridium sp.]